MNITWIFDAMFDIMEGIERGWGIELGKRGLLKRNKIHATVSILFTFCSNHILYALFIWDSESFIQVMQNTRSTPTQWNI